jgi:hypothetical protein
MDIVFEHNPRKKIPREALDKWMAEKGLRETGSGDASSEKKTEVTADDA